MEPTSTTPQKKLKQVPAESDSEESTVGSPQPTKSKPLPKRPKVEQAIEVQDVSGDVSGA